MLEAEFLQLVDAAATAPPRLRAVASALTDAVGLLAHDLWCMQAYVPASPDRANTLRLALIDAALTAVDFASGDTDAAALTAARLDVDRAAADLRSVAATFSFPEDVCKAAFGVAHDDLVDERGLFSATRLLGAYYGRYSQLASRIETLLSVLTSAPPDILNALRPAEALVVTGRPLVTLRTAVRTRDLFESKVVEDLEALARPLRNLKLAVDRSAASHAALARLVAQRRGATTAEERALLDLDIYRRMVEGQLRPWGWTLLRVLGRRGANAPELSSLRDQLRAEGNPLLADAARAILPEARNAAAHEDYAWDDESGVLRVGEFEVSPDDIVRASDLAYAFMIGAESAWTCTRHSSSALAQLLDSEDPAGGLQPINLRAAIDHFGTNGLKVRHWTHDSGTFTVLLDDLPFQRVNPCFQAVMWASRLLKSMDRFVVTMQGFARPAMDLPRPALDATFLVWREAVGRFPAMPLSTFLPANAWARLAVELPDEAARAVAWHALNDAVHAYEDALDMQGSMHDRLLPLLARLDLVVTAVAATIATLPAAAIDPLVDVLELSRAAAAAATAVVQGFDAAPAARLEERIRDLHEASPCPSFLPTVDPRPLDSIIG